MKARSLLLLGGILAVSWVSLEPISGLGQTTRGLGTFVSCDPGSDPCPDPWFPPNECNPWQPGCTPDYPEPINPTPPPSGNPNGPEPTPPPSGPVPLDPLPGPDGRSVRGRRLGGSCTDSCSEVYSSCTSVCADSDFACTERCGVTNQSCMATCAQQPDPWEEHVKECERDCVGDSTCYDNCINQDALPAKKAGVASALSRAAPALKDAQCEQMCNTAGAQCLNACGLDGTCNNRCIAVMDVCRTACEPPSVPACTTCSTSFMTCLNTCATTCGTDPSCLSQCNSACVSTDSSCLASCGSASAPAFDAPAASRLTYAGTCPSQCQELWGWIACSNRNEDQAYCAHNLQLCMADCQSDPDASVKSAFKAAHRAISALKDQATCQHGCDAAYNQCNEACDSGNGDCFSACAEVLSQCTFTCIPGRNVATASATSPIVSCVQTCKSSAKDASAKCKYAEFAKRCYQNVVRTAKTCEAACQKLSVNPIKPVAIAVADCPSACAQSFAECDQDCPNNDPTCLQACGQMEQDCMKSCSNAAGSKRHIRRA